MPTLPLVMDAYIFYFDLIGVRDQFLADQAGTLERIRAFQAQVRQCSFPFSGESRLKTLSDNVWACVSANEQIPDVRMLELAACTMSAATKHGFPKFFGVITRGDHPYDLADRTLTTTGDPTEILIQHIDMTSEPHIRAAFAEKWSAHLAKTNSLPAPSACVWVSEEVFPGELEDCLCGLEAPVAVLPPSFDLKKMPGHGGAVWPFSQSRFRAVALPEPAAARAVR